MLTELIVNLILNDILLIQLMLIIISKEEMNGEESGLLIKGGSETI